MSCALRGSVVWETCSMTMLSLICLSSVAEEFSLTCAYVCSLLLAHKQVECLYQLSLLSVMGVIPISGLTISPHQHCHHIKIW